MVTILDAGWNHMKLQHDETIIELGKTFTPRADVIIFPGGFEPWDWTNVKTYCNKHDPGITINVINYMIEKGCTEIILTKGYHDVLKTDPEIIKYFQGQGITIYHLNSKEAILKWNQIKNKPQTGMLFHATC